MTKEQAAKCVGNWWRQTMKAGTWDNGDTKTEMAHLMFSAMVRRPTEDEIDKVADAIERAMLDGDFTNDIFAGELYSDYGCPAVDAIAKGLGVKYQTLLHGPQKAGTQMRHKDGDFTVRACGGYRQGWTYLEPDELAKESP